MKVTVSAALALLATVAVAQTPTKPATVKSGPATTKTTVAKPVTPASPATTTTAGAQAAGKIITTGKLVYVLQRS